MPSDPRKPATYIYPVLLVAVIAFFWKDAWHAGLGRSDFAGHVGLIASFAEQLREQSDLPLWTADWNSGSSLLFWYIQPLISTFVLLPFVEQWGIIDGIRIGDTFFLALAGLAMYAFGRHLTGSRPGAFLGALVYTLHPSVFMFVGAVGHIHQPVSMAIIPIFFLTWLRLAEVPNRPNALLTAMASALLFYDMERFWLTLPHALLVYFIAAQASGGATQGPRQFGRAFGIAVAVGAGMSALVAFPALPALFERPLLQWHDAASIEVFRRFYSFPDLLALVDRNGVFADPLKSLIPREFVSLPGQWYQGIVALLFVTIGSVLVARGASSDSSSAAAIERGKLTVALTLMVLALLIAFGVHAVAPKHWLLFGGLADESLGFGLTAMLAIAAIVLAGFFVAIASLLLNTLVATWPGRRGVWLGLVPLLVVTFLFAKPFVLLANSIFIYAHLRAPSHFAFPMLPFLLGTAACLVTPAWIRAVGEHRGTWLVAAVVTLHLIDVHPYQFRSAWSYPDSEVRGWYDAYATLEERPAGRVLDTHHYNPVADMLTVRAGKRDAAWSWLSWSSTRYIGDVIKSGFFDSMRVARKRPERASQKIQMASHLSGLANVRFVTRIQEMGPPMPESPHFQLVSEAGGIEIYENLRALEYVQFYPQLALLAGPTNKTVPMVGALAQEGIASFTLEDDVALPELPIDYWYGASARALVDTDVAPLDQRPDFEGQQPESSRGNPNPCNITGRNANSIELDCVFERPGTLVIAEAWFPNWQVDVSGEKRPALRINHAFQGVAVAAGATTLAFEHIPSLATRIGKLVSLASWLAMGAAWMYLTRASTRATRVAR